MRKKTFIFSIIISILVLIFAIVWPIGRYLILRSNSIEKQITNLEEIVQKLGSAYLAEGSFESDFFSATVQDITRDKDFIRGIIIFSNTSGIEYLYTFSPNYLQFRPETYRPETSTPQYDINEFLEYRITLPFFFENRTDLRIDFLISLFSRNIIFLLFRDSLIILGALLIFIIVVLSLRNGKKGYGNREESPPLQQPSQPPKPQEESNKSSSDKNKKTLFSPVSGLGWEEYLEDRLGFELRKSASFDQDLVFCLMRLMKIDYHSDTYKSVAGLLLKTFPFQDCLFEYGKNSFGIIIPNIDLNQGIKEIERFITKINSNNKGNQLTIFIGMSSRNGRLMSSNRILEETKSALKKASESKKSTIIAFRPDPVKYREYIASKL